ncbi:CLUMA_CG004459, isoform A [Clunio marinus]|uniref:CLUMA_CG004459, isoform A n=1 Tax=Clunio marinus TaxID=568069 RepID=A0A1J1HRT5_9DIPT|nr:CLUMA_CG004459, isoform A [Clunio marinus]
MPHLMAIEKQKPKLVFDNKKFLLDNRIWLPKCGINLANAVYIIRKRFIQEDSRKKLYDKLELELGRKRLQKHSKMDT